MQKFYTSDAHFYHANIIKYASRKFSSTREMHDNLIENWNSIVYNDDIVYVLGDMFMLGKGNKPFSLAINILSQLCGNIRILPGNHDKNFWSWMLNNQPDYLFKSNITIQSDIHEDIITINNKEYPLIMCHYPLLSWNKKAHGSIHIHGHVHSNIKSEESERKRIHIGVDAWNMKPVSEKMLVEYICNKDGVWL